MNSFIKKFIENYINIIEYGEWKHVFLNWYNLAADIWPDDETFSEFIDMLRNAGIEPDMNARHDVLYDEIIYTMEDTKKDKFDEHHIGQFYLINKLHSQLGYTNEEVHKIMDEVAKELGLRYTAYYGGGYTW